MLYEVEGARIAHLSYAYGFNGIPLPEGALWAANQIDPERIAADARAAKAFGAQLVVVSLHWGTECQSDPTAEQQRVAYLLSQEPAIDLMIGHHAHVVQPILHHPVERVLQLLATGGGQGRVAEGLGRGQDLVAL